MNPREAGFLLLTCKLGNPDRKVLSVAQMRTLYQRINQAELPREDRDLTSDDILRLGYGPDFSRRVVALLEEETLLKHYLYKAKKSQCVPLTRVSTDYPRVLRQRLGPEAPGVLWAKGDVSILDTPMISLVGSRALEKENRAFAERVGLEAACQGYTLVSGNARGADRAAQDACLEAGGKVISIVADELSVHQPCEGVLYLSEDGFDEEFSAQRALSRNRCIHAMAEKTFVAQCSYQKGGTWDGTVKNLRFGWSPVFVFADGSPSWTLLCEMGAQSVVPKDMARINALQSTEKNFLL